MRPVAFATWSERLGQLLFFESESYVRPDYFVPRSIEANELQLRGRERTPRMFPQKGDDAWKDVSLYLGIRLAPSGAVAVFCGRKDTASGLAERAVEVYQRGFDLPAPAQVSDANEIQRLTSLATKHFGAESMVTKAAALGIFVHHGTTPQGFWLPQRWRIPWWTRSRKHRSSSFSSCRPSTLSSWSPSPFNKLRTRKRCWAPLIRKRLKPGFRSMQMHCGHLPHPMTGYRQCGRCSRL